MQTLPVGSHSNLNYARRWPNRICQSQTLRRPARSGLPAGTTPSRTDRPLPTEKANSRDAAERQPAAGRSRRRSRTRRRASGASASRLPSAAAAAQPPKAPSRGRGAEEGPGRKPRRRTRREPKTAVAARRVATLNIAKLQAMSMPELNQMAARPGRRELRHHAQARGHLPHPAEERRAQPACCSPKACWKCCPRASASCARRASTTCPARRTFTSRPRRSAASTCRPATWSPARSGRPRKRRRFFALLKVEAVDQEDPGQGQGQDPFRQPDAAVPEQAVHPGNRRRTSCPRACWTWSAPSAKARAA